MQIASRNAQNSCELFWENCMLI